LSLKKDDPNSFAKEYPDLRQVSKVIALSATYGTTAPKMVISFANNNPPIHKTTQQAQEIIDDYFEKFPNIKNLMLSSHEMAKNTGQVVNLFGRPRRMPLALKIKDIYGKTPHSELPYEVRNTLNLAINHRIQSTGASIMNRAAIRFKELCKELAKTNIKWSEVFIVMQVHDELIAEAPQVIAQDVAMVLKEAMEHTTKLPGVDLIAEPKIAKNLAELK
jgi:DNA polymerase-1